MTKQEAIEELKKHKEVMEVTLLMKASREKDYKYPAVLEALDKSIEAIEKQINDRWIPVTEKLPEVITGYFIVCLKNGTVLTANYTSFSKSFREISSTGITSFYEDNPVIAWKPLPESYKGD